jgi:thiol:disulfide interchange protein DsbD
LLRAIKLPSVDDDGKVGIFRIGTGIASIVLAGFFLAAINGTSLGKLASFLPPDPYPTMIGKAQVSGEGEIPDYDQALTAAKDSNKPLLIDFTGIYCTNCRDMELNVFPHVKKEFAQFERAKLYTDRIDSESDQKHQKIKEQMTGSVANPQYAILSPDGKVVSTMAYTDNVEVFRKFLEEGFAKATQ